MKVSNLLVCVIAFVGVFVVNAKPYFGQFAVKTAKAGALASNTSE